MLDYKTNLGDERKKNVLHRDNEKTAWTERGEIFVNNSRYIILIVYILFYSIKE